jgi:hypothetical protein
MMSAMHRASIQTASIVAGLAACWHAPEPRATETLPAPLLDFRPPLVPPRSVWAGYYECAQGRTAVELTIKTSPSGSARAVFAFGPHADNPSVPAGSYRLTGTFRADDDARLELTLAPLRWIDQPAGYTMTAVAARSDRRRRHLEGAVLSPSCGELVVERVR